MKPQTGTMPDRATGASIARLTALVAGVLCATQADLAAQQIVVVHPDAPPGSAVGLPATRSALQEAMAGIDSGAVFRLAPGVYNLLPESFVDPTCGNCLDPETDAAATVGLRISGTGVQLAGSAADSVVIVTHAGYGILFEDCRGCRLAGVTVTGGRRDPDGQATDAGIVVRRSEVRLEDCRVTDNIGGDSTIANVVVGIAGVAGREGSVIDLHGCRIERNSWDGVALYRGARATITDNVIDGIDNAGGAAGGGRGVGIGLTWDASAVVSGNLVRRYWKGIGVFVNARALVRNNIVEDMLTWGIAYWGADSTGGSASIEGNVVYRTGACGVIVDRPSGGYQPVGRLIDNIVVETGQNERYDSGEPYCMQRPLARHNVPEGFTISGNLFSGNRQPGDGPLEPEVALPELWEGAGAWLDELAGRGMLHEAAFLRETRGGRN